MPVSHRTPALKSCPAAVGLGGPCAEELPGELPGGRFALMAKYMRVQATDARMARLKRRRMRKRLRSAASSGPATVETAVPDRERPMLIVRAAREPERLKAAEDLLAARLARVLGLNITLNRFVTITFILDSQSDLRCRGRRRRRRHAGPRQAR